MFILHFINDNAKCAMQPSTAMAIGVYYDTVPHIIYALCPMLEVETPRRGQSTGALRHLLVWREISMLCHTRLPRNTGDVTCYKLHEISLVSDVPCHGRVVHNWALRARSRSRPEVTPVSGRPGPPAETRAYEPTTVCASAGSLTSRCGVTFLNMCR